MSQVRFNLFLQIFVEVIFCFRPEIYNSLMDGLGAAVVERLNKIFKNKSDILTNILTELLDADTRTVLHFSEDFKTFISKFQQQLHLLS